MNRFIFFKQSIGIAFCVLLAVSTGCSVSMAKKDMKKEFSNPSGQYRPQPFMKLTGKMTPELMIAKLNAAHAAGMGGVSAELSSSATPAYQSKEFYLLYRDILEHAKSLDMQVVFYDDVDFPSGKAAGRINSDYPHLRAQMLRLTEKNTSGDASLKNVLFDYPGEYVGTVALNPVTHQRIDISDQMTDKKVSWEVPSGEWKIMVFSMEQGGPLIDYMNEESVDKYIELLYEPLASHVGEYFGTVLEKTFFDDVGFLYHTNPWNKNIDTLFTERYGKDPLIYYPALWYDIGEETLSARNAFFGIRSELIGGVFTRKIAEWCENHGLKASGHAGGNYEPNPNLLYGDPFKFYKYQQIPMQDMIHGYPYGRPGFKLISSVADLNNRGIVASEIFAAYTSRELDRKMLYRATMEAMVRGVNFFIPYESYLPWQPIAGAIPTLEGEKYNLIAEFPNYTAWAGRSNSLLQGGRRVSDIALIFPIESLEAVSPFTSKKDIDPSSVVVPRRNSTFLGFGASSDEPFVMPTERVTTTILDSASNIVHKSNDYNKISDLLSNQIRRDFTYVSSQEFVTDKFQIENGTVFMNTPDTWQRYKLLILPSSQVISVEMLQKMRDFYLAGGRILSTAELPFKSVEFGKDAEVGVLIKEIYGVDSQPSERFLRENQAGGKLLYLPKTTIETLTEAINQLLPDGDVIIQPIEKLTHKDRGDVLIGVDVYKDLPQKLLGAFSYIHKVKDGLDVYLFANSTNEPINTQVKLQGKKKLEKWDPHTGTFEQWPTKCVEENGHTYTVVDLSMDPVNSVFAVGR